MEMWEKAHQVLSDAIVIRCYNENNTEADITQQILELREVRIHIINVAWFYYGNGTMSNIISANVTKLCWFK